MKTDQWRLLLAFVLSFVVIYVFQAIMPQPEPAPEPAEVQEQQAEPAPERSQQAAHNQPVTTDIGTEKASGEAGPAPREASAPETVVGDTEARDVPVETAKVDARFSNRGGVLVSWKLKAFRDANGALHDLVPQEMPPGYPQPFSLRFDDDALTRRVREALFAVQTGQAGTLRFDYEDAAGLRVVKRFTISPDTYELTADIEASVDGRRLTPVLQWGPALGPLRGRVRSRYARPSRGILDTADKVQRLDAGDLEDQSSYEGAFDFGGVGDQYFLSALVKPGPARFDFEPLDIAVPPDPAVPDAEEEHVTMVAYEVQLDPAAGAQRLYLGPKSLEELNAVDGVLARAIDFGRFLGWLVAPLLTSLKWLNGYIGNYGWSIIALTILINAIIFPLRHKSVVSMRKMQEIQPEVKAIQDRYAKLKSTDPAKQKMNTELMNLYRERGANPASGCVPTLLTMPVLYAFYRLLAVAVELRGAPFIGWITDLSAPDPLYIMPIITGVAMVAQQRLTPNTLEPTQQKMMMLMPIVFTFVFLQAPSGLVLYWLVGNIWAIGQQKVTNHLIGPPKVRHVRPPAERRLKKAGAGKTQAAGKGGE